MEVPVHPAEPPSPRPLWKVWGVLSGLALVGAVAGYPYLLAFVEKETAASRFSTAVAIVSVLFQSLPALPAGALGLWLGEKVGLGAPWLWA